MSLLLTFMHWPIPRTPDAGVFALCGSLLALLHLVALQRLARKLLVAVLALAGQFGHRLLHSQVSGGGALGNLDATIWTCCRLIAKSFVRGERTGVGMN